MLGSDVSNASPYVTSAKGSSPSAATDSLSESDGGASQVATSGKGSSGNGSSVLRDQGACQGNSMRDASLHSAKRRKTERHKCDALSACAWQPFILYTSEASICPWLRAFAITFSKRLSHPVGTFVSKSFLRSCAFVPMRCGFEIDALIRSQITPRPAL